MAKSKSTKATIIYQGLGQIDRELGACRQTLLCAAEALGSAEGSGFKGDSTLELASAAIRVVERCSAELMRIENAVDRLSIEAAQP